MNLLQKFNLYKSKSDIYNHFANEISKQIIKEIDDQIIDEILKLAKRK